MNGCAVSDRLKAVFVQNEVAKKASVLNPRKFFFEFTLTTANVMSNFMHLEQFLVISEEKRAAGDMVSKNWLKK
jgi:hypothetical protein